MPTNLQRAMWAEMALYEFNEQVSTRDDSTLYDPADEIIKDLICDLCHFLNLDERAGCKTPEQIMELLEGAFRLFEDELANPDEEADDE